MAETGLMLRKVARGASRLALRMATRRYWNGWLYTFDTRNAVRSGDARYRRISDAALVAASNFDEIRCQASNAQPDIILFGAWNREELAAICWFHSGDTYRRRGGLFPLADDEAELGQITTAHAYRGKGVARGLIQYAAGEMGCLGFSRLYARIWHDNVPSIRAFEHAGWQVQCRFVSLEWRGLKRPRLYRLSGWRQPASAG